MTEAPEHRRVGPVALLIPILIVALWWLRIGPPTAGVNDGEPPVSVGEPPEVTVWRARFELEDGRTLIARLAPWHADEGRQSFEAQTLRRRLGLVGGEAFRLELGIEGPGDEVELDVAGLRVTGEGGALAVPDAGGGAVGTLLSAPRGLLSPDTALQMALWGPAPAGDLTLAGLELAFPAVDDWTLEQTTERADRLPRSLAQLALADGPAGAARAGGAGAAELERANERIAELEGRVAALNHELAEVQDDRIEREMAWIEHQRVLASLDDLGPLAEQLRVILDLPPLPDEEEPEVAAAPVESPAVLAAREASAQRARRLNLLLRSESVWGLELLEAGELIYPLPDPDQATAADGDGDGDGDGDADSVASADTAEPGAGEASDLAMGTLESLLDPVPAEALAVPDVEDQVAAAPHPIGTGPVVFRLVDDRGRLAGSLVAERLSLEGSRAGRSLTLTLSNGYRSEGGERYPFEGGRHRVELRHVDPEPFMDALPEFFAAEDLEREINDGRWSLPVVRATLNGLLEDEPAGSGYRLAWLGGIVGDEWRDVHFEVLDDDGRAQRHVFADSMSLRRNGGTVTIELRDGSTIRGDEKAPFLDGRMRIVIPRADGAAWSEAQLPGFAAPAASEAQQSS